MLDYFANFQGINLSQPLRQVIYRSLSVKNLAQNISKNLRNEIGGNLKIICRFSFKGIFDISSQIKVLKREKFSSCISFAEK